MERLKRIWQAANVVVTFFVPSPQHAVAADLKLTLVIYDYARLSEAKLGEVEGTASEIFQRAGVQLLWVEGFAYAAQRRDVLNPAREDPATLVVKLQPESEAARYGVRSVCGGIGLASGVIIFVPKIDPRSTVSDATRIGHVIAHEIGHVLLGPNAHSIVGIMRGTLLQQDWENAAQGALGFTHSQNQKIRTWITEGGRSGEAQRNRSFGPVLWSADRIGVGLCNVGQTPKQEIARAKAAASYVFGVFGVDITWSSCGALGSTEASAEPKFELRLMDQSLQGARGIGRLGESEQIKQGVMFSLPGQTERIRAHVVARTGADITGQVYKRGRVEHPTLAAAEGEATEGIRSAQDTIPSPTPQHSQAIGLYNQSIFGQEQGRYVEDDAAFCKGLQASEQLAEPSSEEIAAQQQLTIRVYNYSPATSLTIRHAEGEAGRILLEAGIHVIWLSCRPTPAEETATRACRADSLMSPILRIAPHAIESLGRLTLGFTLPAPGGAINATVVYSRVQELVSNRVDSEQKIFGYGIAHEIGHVLLGPEHSFSGLMRAQWHTSDWRLADVEQLRFSPREAIAMGAEVVRRTKQTTAKTCPAGR